MGEAKTQNDVQSNQTIRAEQAKAELGGQRPEDKAQTDQQREEKSAIGGGKETAQTGEQGRTRSELDQNRNTPAGHER